MTSKPSVAELLRAWRGHDHAEKCDCAICAAIAEVEAVAREMRSVLGPTPATCCQGCQEEMKMALEAIDRLAGGEKA